jgi:hypothetical protein
MRTGDIFMGAFNAERVMHNHFGYRTPIAQPLRLCRRRREETIDTAGLKTSDPRS